MATLQENLQTSLNQLGAILVDITANPKPDYSVGGRSVSWNAYRQSIIADMKTIREQMALANEDGPTFQVTSRGEV